MRFSTILAAAVLVARALPGAASDPTTPNYMLHPGDELLVGVFDDPKMQPLDITITPDGKFSFPLIGTIIAAGKSIDQLRTEIQAKLRKYISEPVVMLSVKEVKGNVAYVVGEVNKPGAFVMNPGLNVLQALSLAGGTNPYAKLDGIIVIRNAPDGQRVFNFRYSQIAGGRNLAQNVELESGDVVLVP